MKPDDKSAKKTSHFSTRPRPALPAGLTKAKVLAVTAVALFSMGFGFLGGWVGARNNAQIASTPKATQQIVSNESQLISSIAEQVGPSVVSIDVTARGTRTDLFGFSQPTEQQGAGTGFIISADGYVATNRHVVPSGTTEVSVTLSDGTQLDDVEVIGRTANSDSLDIAFLKIKNTKGKKLTPVKLGDSSQTQVGDKVIAIGNALGQFQNTVTSGIISGYGRDLQASDGAGGSRETLQNMFQTDAAINQGNSGGPLVNMNNEVIGINTAVAGAGAQNIGFAIPINDVQGLIKSVLASGKLERPYLGVRYISLNDDYAYEYNLETKRGAYIAPSSGSSSSVLSDSPAAKAGLQEKDIIVKVNNQAIDENNSLTSVLGRHQVGQTVTLTIIRDGQEKTIQAKLEAAPQD